jgi:hypothetical protein
MLPIQTQWARELPLFVLPDSVMLACAEKSNLAQPVPLQPCSDEMRARCCPTQVPKCFSAC